MKLKIFLIGTRIENWLSELNFTIFPLYSDGVNKVVLCILYIKFCVENIQKMLAGKREFLFAGQKYMRV